MKDFFEKPDLKDANPYDFLLGYFTGDAFRELNPVWWRNEPFILDDRVCATDGHAVICFDKSLSNKTYKPIEGKDKTDVSNLLHFQQNQLFAFSTDLLKTALENCPLIDDYEETQCNQCSSIDYENNQNFFCEQCWNTGIMEVLNGEKTFNLESVIIFKGTHFFAIKILEIYKAALVLGVETIIFLYAKDHVTPHYFKIGDIILLMAPMMINGNESEIVYEIS